MKLQTHTLAVILRQKLKSHSRIQQIEGLSMRQLTSGILTLAAAVAGLSSLYAVAGDCAAPVTTCNTCQPKMIVRPAICCRRAPCNALRAPIIKPVCPIKVSVTCSPQRCPETCRTVKLAAPEPKVTCCSPKPATCAAPHAVDVLPVPSGKVKGVPMPPVEVTPAPPKDAA